MIKVFDEQGVGYPNVKELCKARGWAYQNFIRVKHRRNFTCEETCLYFVNKPPKKYKRHTDSRCVPVTVYGVRYKTIKEACEKLGIKRATVRCKQKQYGLSVEQAIEVASLKKVDHLGNQFKTFKEMAAYHNVDYATYLARMNRGYDLKKCAEYKSNIVDDNGVKYRSYSALCKANNFNLNTFYSCLHKYEYDTVQACEFLKSHKKKTYTYNGETYTSLQKMCQVAGIEYHRVQYQQFVHNLDGQWAFDIVLDKKLKGELTSRGKKKRV